jgi:SanA protein
MMLRKLARFFLRGALVGLVVALLALAVPNLLARIYAQSRLFPAEQAPSAPVAIVFGAGLTRSGTPSAILRDRVETAAALYASGRVEKLLMSGDNRFVEYNEPAAMRDYAIELGIPEEDIVLDFAGRRTYDTCYRARHIFGVQEAILVTQQFHLTRALFTCNNLGVESEGVIAEGRRFRRSAMAFWQLREVAATSVAFWEVWVSRPLPVLGKPEPIFQNTGARQPFTLMTASS